MEQLRFKVRVNCMTFNHAPYIVDAMNGFCMQETTFPFVCIIIDDASTDGEPEIIKAYLEENFDLDDKAIVINEETENYRLVFARHKTNLSCYFAALFLKYNHYRIGKPKMPYVKEYTDTEYVAMCEGDDYWIAPEKLQKQVDFLESNPNYGMVHTDFDLTKGVRRHFKEDPDDDGNWFPRILTEGMAVGTCTVLMRRSICVKVPKLNAGKGWLMGDYPMWIEMAHEAKVKYLPIVTAKYRVLESSASHSTDIKKMIAFRECSTKIKQFYADYYHVQLKDGGYTSSFYETIVRDACRLGDKDVATQYYETAKKKGMVSGKCRLFYACSRYSLLKKLVELYIKI